MGGNRTNRGASCSQKSRRKAQNSNRSALKSEKSKLSLWGVIKGFDNAVEKMNACFSNLLYELQKDEIAKKEAEERKR